MKNLFKKPLSPKRFPFSIKCTLACFLIVAISHAQKTPTYKVISIAFWNLENLFDTQNDSLVLDDERTPSGAYHWTDNKYHSKIERLANIILQMNLGGDSGPNLLGVCEVENRSVMNDLAESLNKGLDTYAFIHEDSPDLRGIDVALMYKKNSFIPVNYQYRRLLLYDENQFRKYTRDQLVVFGYLEKEPIYIIVNHWPSRSGGEERSKPFRIEAAKLNLKIIDSITNLNPEAKIISMGDFNDDPISDSFKKILKTNVGIYKRPYLFNPMEALYKKGQGSLAYRDRWNLFDQFYMTESLIGGKGMHFTNALVFKPLELIETKKPYRGYPKRTYLGTTYQEGYSDHIPIIMYLVKYE